MANIRISDIAKKAGVSAGTVDRVIHNRGRVSQENIVKVENAIEELKYKPNLLARSLVSRKGLNIIAILPVNKKGEYWNSIDIGISKAADNFEYNNMNLEKIYFDQYSKSSFIAAAETLKTKKDVNGVIIATQFNEQVIKLAKYLDEMQILYVFVDSEIEDCNNLAYFGLNAYDSGYLSAKLILDITPPNKYIVLIDFIMENGEKSTQAMKRGKGFVECFENEEQRNRLLFFDFHVDSTNMEIRFGELFEEHPNIGGLITFSSRSFFVADYLNKKKIENVKMIGFDLIDKNLEHLKQGAISFLISQHPEKQGYESVKSLFEKVILKADIKKINYMPIDIITVNNIKYYQDIN